jgi:hypothetical protein
VSKAVRQLHQETAFAIFSGLITKLPLTFLCLYILVDLLEWNSALKITIVTQIVLSIEAYIRLYGIRRHFSKETAKEISESQG